MSTLRELKPALDAGALAWQDAEWCSFGMMVEKCDGGYRYTDCAGSAGRFYANFEDLPPIDVENTEGGISHRWNAVTGEDGEALRQEFEAYHEEARQESLAFRAQFYPSKNPSQV